jgi:multicomponent Na+:H+ antiporter subunit C
MHLLLALLVGVLFAAGVYLILQRHLLRIIFGLILLGNAVNLLVFTVGRAARLAPPLIPEGMTVPPGATANPLPQALVLTAIVISFGLVAFALVLAYRAYATLGTTDTDVLEEATPPAPAPATNGLVPDSDDGTDDLPQTPESVVSDDLAR